MSELLDWPSGDETETMCGEPHPDYPCHEECAGPGRFRCECLCCKYGKGEL
jgi:hypothetical protein